MTLESTGTAVFFRKLRQAFGNGERGRNIRSDQFSPQGVRLRYVLCPQKPFLDSEEQRVCNGK
jgi:hypothetical protein